MNTKQAYEEGQYKGKDICSNIDTLLGSMGEDNFISEAYDILENHKQFSGDITYELKSDAQWEAFEKGFEIQVKKEVKARYGKGRKA